MPFALVNSLFVLSCAATTPPLPHQIDLLQRFPVHTTQVEKYRLAYLDVGQGPPVILLHGFGGSMWHWEQQQTALAKTHRILTVDLLGSGLSDKPRIDYSPALLLTLLEQFMDNLHIQKATLVGNSLGAGVAIGMALTHPDRVDQLVLISGFPAKVVDSIASPKYKGFIQTRPPLWMAKLGIWLTGRWTTKIVLEEIIHDHTLITPMVIERSFRNRVDRGFLHPIYSQLDYLSEWETDYAPRIDRIPHRTLIIWGSEDRVFPLSVGRSMNDRIPNSTFLEVPDSGHLPQWEKPNVVNPALVSFLAGIE